MRKRRGKNSGRVKIVGHDHANAQEGYRIKDIILGGQDGIVNVLGVVLTVAEATKDIQIVLISGLAATFAESISMGAVAYTSSKAAHDFYQSQLISEKRAVKYDRRYEIKDLEEVYSQKGFKGKLLRNIINHIAGRKKIFVETLIQEKMHLFPEEYAKPLENAFVVGVASLIGSFVPLIPFFFGDVSGGMFYSIIFSIVALFATGAKVARMTVGNWIKGGVKMAAIGILAALAGFVIGKFLGVVIV